MKIGQYQELYAISKSDMTQVDKDIQSVMVLTGKTERDIESMLVTEFNNLAKKVNTELQEATLNAKPISFLKGNGLEFQINYKIGTMTSGQWIECQTWLAGDVIENMHKILASISVPVKKFWWTKKPVKKYDHKELSEAIQDVEFAEAYGCIVFFCAIFRSSIMGIRDYLESELILSGMSKEMAEMEMDLLVHILDGYTIQNSWQISAGLN